MDIPALGRVYVLQNKATGFALTGQWHLDIEPERTVWATPLGDPHLPNQRWVFVESADQGFYRLAHDEIGFMLDSNAERQVYLTEDNGGSYQKWRMNDGGEGYWWLQNLATGFALDSNLEQDVYTMRPNAGAFQRWKFIAV